MGRKRIDYTGVVLKYDYPGDKKMQGVVVMRQCLVTKSSIGNPAWWVYCLDCDKKWIVKIITREHREQGIACKRCLDRCVRVYCTAGSWHRDKYIWKRRYQDGWTLERIGRSLNVSRVRIWEILQRLKKKHKDQTDRG